jgi:hypothetical protein
MNLEHDNLKAAKVIRNLREELKMIGNSSNAASFPSRADYIREIERTRTQALVSRDMELAWQLHSPEYQLITPSGTSFSRDRYLEEIGSGNLVYLRWESGQMDVRASEKMAFVRYQAMLELDSGTPFQCWHTDSYELNDNFWQVVWSQATVIKQGVV